MKDNVFIKESERVDDLHRNGYLIIQDPKNFCFGVDAVLLSGFASVKKGEKVIDLGTGTGVIPILMEGRYGGESYYGIDIQEESVEMAQRSIKLNSLENKIKTPLCDIKEVFNKFECSSFDVVTSNPPYMNTGGGIINEYSPKAVARHEILCDLDDVVYAAAKLLKFGGRFYMIHRPHRLVDIFYVLRKHKIEPKVIRFIHPYFDRDPSMVLIESSRGGKSMLKVLPPLVIYEKNGEYTEEIYKIYYK